MGVYVSTQEPLRISDLGATEQFIKNVPISEEAAIRLSDA
jgi:hypothetical protein